MAQAARLNLRMQKELKLLLTDPPPAASFPTLSGDSSASSLTSIDALLQGPEGTVYANGVFKMKIQIPERYPFQPPIVTFATPIYHPNIDTGGRICLDILNLPPKGMWQPSLNISTVLTSIWLLLSEPNPDDGLMHEASRDYKYNRQAFDQNARSLTEKYARAGEQPQGALHSHETRTEKTNMEGSGASSSNQMTKEANKELQVSRSNSKLSFKVSVRNGGSCGRNQDEKENLAPVQLIDQSALRSHETRTEKTKNEGSVASSSNQMNKCLTRDYDTALIEAKNDLQAPRNKNKLSLKVSVRNEGSFGRNGYEKENLSPVQQSDQSEAVTALGGHETEGSDVSSSNQMNKGLTCVYDSALKEAKNEVQAPRNKSKLSLKVSVRNEGSSGRNQDEKENLAPVQLTDQSALRSHETRTEKTTPQGSGTSSSNQMNKGLTRDHDTAPKEAKNEVQAPRKNSKLSLKVSVRNESSSGQHQDEKENLAPAPAPARLTDQAEAVIVLDSESEDEIIPVRSKLSLAKRSCFSRKRKSAH